MVRDELQATARLAHLDLTEDEAAAELPAFELMLEYFAAMKAADEDEGTAGLFAVQSSGSSSTGNRLRLDINNNNNQNSNPLLDLAGELLDRAPQSENRFIVIPNVL
ncbi:MAG: glutamyl-tRNA amidotransferase [Spirochaetae bacterium HGW-Spirochaetae-7]|jgi:Asp-tRNA(Asn)/Glu-tRNA(Gln) amidotransferase C subunit|nr:MAG: glutamyl-tRNA amidotransferase [Spirochaetae bacterium HGW-Spirochaetae-7]